MPIRKLIFFFVLLCFSLSVQAQQPPQQAQLAEQEKMMQKMEQAIGSALTQKDVDVFLKVVEASQKLKAANKAEWEAIGKLSNEEREKKINEIANLAADEDFLISIARIQFAVQASDPAQLAQVQQQYEMMKQQLPAAKAQFATLPEEQRKTMEKQIDLQVKMMELMTNYPKEGLAVYNANKAKIEAGIKVMEEE